MYSFHAAWALWAGSDEERDRCGDAAEGHGQRQNDIAACKRAGFDAEQNSPSRSSAGDSGFVSTPRWRCDNLMS
jgi:hypothetical protein